MSEPTFFDKLRVFATENNREIHLNCTVFSTNECICRNEDGSLVPEKWTDADMQRGLDEQIGPYFKVHTRPYAMTSFTNALNLDANINR